MHTIANLDSPIREAIARAFVLADGVRVLRVPCQAITVPPCPLPTRALLHPVARAVKAQEDGLLGVRTEDRHYASPLRRAEVYAAFLAFGWTPDAYERAVEKTARFIDNGMKKVDAERRAVAEARREADPPRTCQHCRLYRLLAPNARLGVCSLHETTVEPTAAAPDCWQRGVTAAEYAAALAHEEREHLIHHNGV